MHAVRKELTLDARVLAERALRDVDVRGVHDDRMLGDELVVGDDAVLLQIDQHLLAHRGGVDDGVLRVSDLDVEAQSIRIEDVVVEPDAVKTGATIRVVDPVHVLPPLPVEAEVEDEHLVPGVRRGVVRHVGHLEQAIERCRRHEALELDLALRRRGDLARQIDAHHGLAEADRVRPHRARERVHVLDRAARRIREGRVVGRVVRDLHVAEDVREVRVREEPPHRVAVERTEVGRVELLVVGDEELFGDRFPEPCVEHSLEVRRRCGGRVARREVREVEVVEAVDEVRLRQLVDVLLEGKVDRVALELDEGFLLDVPDILALHARTEPRLDLGVLEVEEVARVVPDEPFLLHRLAVAADRGVGLEHEVVVVAALGERSSGREPCNSSANDERAYLLHRREH